MSRPPGNVKRRSRCADLRVALCRTGSSEGQNTYLNRTVHAIAYDEIHDEIVVQSNIGQAVLTFRGAAAGDEAPFRIYMPRGLTLDPAVSGYARGSRVTGEGTACATRPEVQADELFPGKAPASAWAVTRQRWRVTTQIRRLADGFDHGLRA